MGFHDLHPVRLRVNIFSRRFHNVPPTFSLSGILEPPVVMRTIFSNHGTTELDSSVLLAYTSRRNVIIPITANAAAISAQEVSTMKVFLLTTSKAIE
jgi:hypothetical protein